MVIKKKQIVTATLAFALGAAIFVNWYYSKPENKQTVDSVKTTQAQETENLGDAQYVSATTAKDTSDDTLTGFKLKRDNAHDEAKETLNGVIKDAKSSADAVSESTKALKELSEDIKAEADLENLITAKTGKDCVVIIDREVCEVIVPKNTLSEAVTLQIKDLVINQTEILSKNITIIELST